MFLLLALMLARESLVVDAAWLSKHINDSDLVLLHVGDKAGYEAGHIPGARYASMSDVSLSDHTAKGLMLEMPPADDLRKRLEALGISDGLVRISVGCEDVADLIADLESALAAV